MALSRPGRQQVLLLSLLLCWFIPAQAQDYRLFVGAYDSAPVSYAEAGEIKGFLPDLLYGLADLQSDWQLEVKLYPWARAQWLVQRGLADGFVTFPSNSRQAYAYFTENPAFIWDFGYLVFRRDNPRAEQMRRARSFDDLSGLVMLGESGSAWEQENIHPSIKRVEYSNPEEALGLLVRRQEGDFMVMNELELAYLVQKKGYEGLLERVSVDFIPNSQLPFHIGIGRSIPDAQQRIKQLDQLLLSEAYQQLLQQVLQRYSGL